LVLAVSDEDLEVGELEEGADSDFIVVRSLNYNVHAQVMEELDGLHDDHQDVKGLCDWQVLDHQGVKEEYLLLEGASFGLVFSQTEARKHLA